MKNTLFLLFITLYSFSFAQESERINNVQLLNINTELAEFGVSFYKNDVVLFVSSKKDRNLKRRDRSHNRMQYLEFYKGLIKNNGQLQLQGKYSSQQFNIIHEADITFTADKKSIYFTLNNFAEIQSIKQFENKKDKKNILRIFRANIDAQGDATNIKPVPFNGKNYSVKNPELSTDGKTLYFVSDMEGGFGKFDIYKVSVNDDGTVYGKPENLGATINTKYNEFFPFLSSSNEFFFSSDGHGGAGFLDIFSSTFENGTYSKPQNVDIVNSEYDDFAFVISPAKKIGFFSSTRKGVGNADIYSFKIDQVTCDQLITGIVKNKLTNKIIPNSTVELYTNNELTESTITDDNGAFKFKTICETDYTINASKEKYTNTSSKITTSNEDGFTEKLTLTIEPLKCHQTVAGIISNKDTNAPLKDIEISLSYNGEIIEKTTSNSEGLYNFNTIANCDSKYIVTTKSENYSSKIKSFITSDVLDAENYLELKLNENQEFVTRQNIKMIKTNPIYFDINKVNINVDAAIELDKVVTIMNKYPNIKIELNSHTDSRAPDAYNMDLSQRRAASAVAYIVSKGIDPSRVTGKGYGETQLVNRCSNGVRCTEAEHQENRRTEFIVITNK